MTRAAAIEPQHQPGLGGSAARSQGPEAETPVPASERRKARLFKGKERIPQQRAVCEYPPRRTGGLALQCRGQRDRKLRIGQRVSWIDRRRIDGAHAPFLEIAAR